MVFNLGERVEGYTNFLWVLELAGLWKLFGFGPENAAPWLSVACTVGTLAVTVWWALRLPGLRQRGLVTWMALGFLCTSATFAVWTSGGGLETRQFTLLVVAAVVCLTVHAETRLGLLFASLSLAAAAYTRPEGPLIAACCFGWFLTQRIVAAGRLRVDLRELGWLVLPFISLVAGHYLFRYAYYGQWLPNTYFAKHVRPWYESGFSYLWAAAIETGLYLLLPLAVLALRRAWRERRDLRMALPLLCIVAHMAYVMRVGGDFLEWRPLDFYWPLLAVPAAGGIVCLGSSASGWLRRRALDRSLFRPFKPAVCAVVVFVPVLFQAGALQAELLFAGAERSYRDWSARQFHLEVDRENASWLLAAPGMDALVSVSDDLRRRLVAQGVATRSTAQGAVLGVQMRDWGGYGQMERGVFPEGALTAMGALGVQSWFLPDLGIVDTLGLTDTVVARNPVAWPNNTRRMAHDRRPPPGYLLEQRGVNIMVHRSAPGPGLALERGAYALEVTPDLWMPFDAADHDWVLRHFDRRRLRMRSERESRESGWARQVARIRGFEAEALATPCERSPHALCLHDGRYRVTLDWFASGGSVAAARASDAGTAEAGVFYFFGPSNWEVLVKVLDGCGVNGHHWVSVASTTDLGFDLEVRDVRAGAEWRYTKESGEPAAFSDQTAFGEVCAGVAR